MNARTHLRDLADALDTLDAQLDVIERWGKRLATVLPSGGRLLVAGNGGSAAEAQHLTAELVGRFADERRPFSALALAAETSSVTALVNDYGVAEMFARQVAAHGRPGDVCLLMSTSGRSANVLAAAARARECGVTSWALTGPWPNPLADACDDALCVDAPDTATVQEVHLVAVHLICGVFEEALS